MSATMYPILGSQFTVEVVPGPSLGVAQVNISSRSASLSPAGQLAALGQVNTYYSTSSGAKIVSVARTESRGHVAVELSRSQVSYTILAADAATEVAAWTTILRTAANLS